MATDQDIIDQYSTPGLKRNEMSRERKRDHLAGLKVSPDQAAEILDKLYPQPERR